MDKDLTEPDEKAELMDNIVRSLDYGDLDHKWMARNYLDKHKRKFTTRRREKQSTDPTASPADLLFHEILDSVSRSSFEYYDKHRKYITSDPSLDAITTLCSAPEQMYDVSSYDSEVFRLSRIFNEIISSTRKLHKCYDCGTNARAIFLKLLTIHRGAPFIAHDEQVRMADEYVVTHSRVKEKLDECHRILRDTQSDMAVIMSLGLQDFGHVWVVEKRFLNPTVSEGTGVRYHHYQSSFKSHLILDFVERMDYGADPYRSLDLDTFFSDLTHLLTKVEAWNDDDVRLFCKLFAFRPVNDITKPDPGFSFTYVVYNAHKP